MGLTQSVQKSKYKNEQLCQDTLHQIFSGYKFIKCRPSFLRNPKTGRCLELDCYNDQLKIGVEYNGKQHYTQVAFFQNHDQFIKQQERDKLKIELCKKNNIKLLVVPYTVKNIPEYINTWVDHNNLRITRNFCTII